MNTLTYKDLADRYLDTSSPVFSKKNRCVYADDTNIFMFVKGLYNFKSNADTAKVIDSNLSYLISQNVLDETDSELHRYQISLSDVLDINLSKKHLDHNFNISFEIPFLSQNGITCLYTNGIFILKKKL